MFWPCFSVASVQYRQTLLILDTGQKHPRSRARKWDVSSFEFCYNVSRPNSNELHLVMERRGVQSPQLKPESLVRLEHAAADGPSATTAAKRASEHVEQVEGWEALPESNKHGVGMHSVQNHMSA